MDGRLLHWEEPLPDATQRFWDNVVTAYRTEADWLETFNRVHSVENPLLAATQGMITAAVWDNAVFQAMEDLTARLGRAQGRVGPAPDEDLRDPWEDTWITVAKGASQKNVSVQGLHLAIVRGDVTARPQISGGTRRVVSQRSLDRWDPNRQRQAAGQKRADHVSP